MPKKGFTLIELMVVIAIIGILGTVISPAIGNAVNKARIAKIVATIHTLETGAESYYSDTGGFATEYGSSYYNGVAYHGLALDDARANWAGPYIKTPLAGGNNPYNPNSFVYMYANLTGGACNPNGFDLNGDGTLDRTGEGNFVCFPYVGSTNAQKIDVMFDKGVNGDWATTGRVKYQASYGGTVNIYLAGGS
jgi:prepilin-type N-terminal cleavage/methylation domain-containing protein